MTMCEICGTPTIGHMIGNGLGVWVETCPVHGDVRGIEEEPPFIHDDDPDCHRRDGTIMDPWETDEPQYF